MLERPPRAAASLLGRPWHAIFAPAPFVCFLLTFITDLIYARSANMMWANMSAWLLTAGLIVSILVVATGVIDFFCERRIRQLGSAWIHGIGSALALILSIFNIFIHSRDAYSSVVPWGLTLSAIVAALVILIGWSGWTMVYRQGVGVNFGERK